MRCRVELLGGLRLIREEVVVSRFRTQKTAGLLAYLAYHLDRAHPREVLLDCFWPEDAPEAARNSLSTALWSLRHQLEPPGVPAGAVIVADRQSVRLRGEAVSTDVAAFEQALAAADRATSAAERAHALSAAVALYRGELLPGHYETWVFPEQERLAERFQAAVARLTEEAAHAGDLPRALRHAAHAVSADPLREDAHRRLIRLHLAGGQPDAALRRYRELERLLLERLDAEPETASRALLVEIEARLRQGAPPPAAPDAVPPALPPSAPRSEPPTGIVTWLLADADPARAAALRGELRQRGAWIASDAEGCVTAAFRRAADALSGAVASAGAGGSRLRIAVHTGDAEPGGAVPPEAACVLRATPPGQILCSEATALLTRSRGDVRLTDLGLYRLVPGGGPERLFAVADARAEPVPTPPLCAEPAGADYLPLALTRFFGREAEQELVLRLLDPAGDEASPPRLLTLTGPGGSGKSRLALECARNLLGAFPRGAWFIPLQDLTDPRRVPDVILEALRVPRLPDRSPMEQLAGELAAGPALLVLDNFEQLLPAGATVIGELLARAPLARCLVTSRRLLKLSGERELPVPPLPVPEGEQTPEALCRCESVRLFTDRAQAARPDFQVTPRNAETVAELCRRLEGIPLALELAAARANVLSSSQILAQLEGRLDRLVSRAADTPERHRTLRAAIDWSYRLLSPELQGFWSRLSVFRGGWTLSAAEAVCGSPAADGPDLLDYLAELRESSLVLGDEAGSELRFRMLETLREFAAEQVPPEEHDLARRHVEWCCALAEEARPELSGREPKEWLDRLEREHDNIRAALAWSVGEGGEGRGEGRAAVSPETVASLLSPRHRHEVAMRLVAALYEFWYFKSHVDEGRYWVDRVLARREGVPDHLLAPALYAASSVAGEQGDDRQSQIWCRECLELFRRQGDCQGIAAALFNLGNIASRTGSREAAAFFQECLELRRESDPHGCCEALRALGVEAMRAGDLDLAETRLRESLDAARTAGHRYAVGAVLINLGDVSFARGRLDEADGCYGPGLEAYRELDSARGVVLATVSLACTALRGGDAGRARALLSEIHPLCPEVREPSHRAAILRKLAVLAADAGNARLAARVSAAANTRAPTLALESTVAEVLWAIG